MWTPSTPSRTSPTVYPGFAGSEPRGGGHEAARLPPHVSRRPILRTAPNRPPWRAIATVAASCVRVGRSPVRFHPYRPPRPKLGPTKGGEAQSGFPALLQVQDRPGALGANRRWPHRQPPDPAAPPGTPDPRPPRMPRVASKPVSPKVRKRKARMGLGRSRWGQITRYM